MDTYDAGTRSRTMRAVRSTDTTPELAVRRALHAAGYRYRVHVKDLPGKPDIVFTRRRKVVFIHGCFWHQHPGCPAAYRPSSSTDYWNAKLDRNMVRDERSLTSLTYGGWSVHVVWECELKNIAEATQRLFAFLGPPRCEPRSRR
jgi:DNA mismatch endonuclease (patch repair protein)